MCGFIVFLKEERMGKDRGRGIEEQCVRQSLSLLEHRGPDELNVLKTEEGNFFGHTRLAIVSPTSGSQPIVHRRKTWVHNGEIYNYRELLKKGGKLSKKISDSFAIGVAYELYGDSFVDHLDGVFALAMEIRDESGKSKVIVARDPLGVKPLYYGRGIHGGLCFASEMKALESICCDISLFPPGHIYTTDSGFRKYYEPRYTKESPQLKEVSKAKELIRKGLEKAVLKRLMGDVKIGALLSGGLDSSLVAALAARELSKRNERLTTFSVGLESSTMDIEKAKLVAKHINSDHHSITYSVKEGLDAIEEMIGLLESYDVTTIRASTPMYLMSKYIRKMGIKSVLSGEGADEMFGGYLYFAHAPSAQEFHEECLKRVSGLHQADLLRADRSTMGASVEARVPFLDLEFLETVLSIDPSLKVISKARAEKWILREAFSETSLLPGEVLWRQKEQFSDGVGYEWVDGLKELAESLVTDAEFSKAEVRFPFNTPTTKEAFLYRRIFSERFSHSDIEKQTAKWIPRWQEYNVDPSGRANKIHDQSVEEDTKKDKALARKPCPSLMAGK